MGAHARRCSQGEGSFVSQSAKIPTFVDMSDGAIHEFRLFSDTRKNEKPTTTQNGTSHTPATTTVVIDTIMPESRSSMDHKAILDEYSSGFGEWRGMFRASSNLPARLGSRRTCLTLQLAVSSGGSDCG